MALFGLFGSSKASVEKHAKRCGNKRAQNPDRWESIQILGQVATGELEAKGGDRREDALRALLSRYTFTVDPSITDGEEKDEVFRWIARAGDLAIAPVLESLRTQDSPSWPLRILASLVSEERHTEEMLAVLEELDTEYERDPQKKLALLSSLEERRHPRIAPVVQRFLEDMNETARFHAVGCVAAQENAEDALDALVEAFLEEDSVRVKVRILDAMIAHGWAFGGEVDLDEVREALPTAYHVDAEGAPSKRSRARAEKAEDEPGPVARPSPRARPKATGGGSRRGGRRRKRK